MVSRMVNMNSRGESVLHTVIVCIPSMGKTPGKDVMHGSSRVVLQRPTLPSLREPARIKPPKIAFLPPPTPLTHACTPEGGAFFAAERHDIRFHVLLEPVLGGTGGGGPQQSLEGCGGQHSGKMTRKMGESLGRWRGKRSAYFSCTALYVAT